MSSISATSSSSPTTRSTRRRGARLRRRAVPAGRPARRVRERNGHRRRTSTGRAPHRRAAEVRRLQGARRVWQQVSTGHDRAWHDHRVHFMGTDGPACRSQRDPDHSTRHRPLDGRAPRCGPVAVGACARGQLVCVPPPSPWPCVVGRARARDRACSSWPGPGSWRTVFVVALAVLVAHRAAARGRALGRDDRVVRHQAGGERLLPRRHRCSALLALGWMWRRASRRRCRSSWSPRSSSSSPAGSPTSRRSATRRSRRRSPRVVRPAAGDARPRPRRGPGGGRRVPPATTAARLRHARTRRRRPGAAPSPVELGAPFVVVGLHLDGRVRDLVVEQERRAPDRAHACASASAPIITCALATSISDVSVHTCRSWTSTTPGSASELGADRVEVDVAGATWSSTRIARRPRAATHAGGSRTRSPRRRSGRSAPTRSWRSTTAATITPTEPAASAIAST